MGGRGEELDNAESLHWTFLSTLQSLSMDVVRPAWYSRVGWQGEQPHGEKGFVRDIEFRHGEYNIKQTDFPCWYYF